MPRDGYTLDYLESESARRRDGKPMPTDDSEMTIAELIVVTQQTIAGLNETEMVVARKPEMQGDGWNNAITLMQRIVRERNRLNAHRVIRPDASDRPLRLLCACYLHTTTSGV